MEYNIDMRNSLHEHLNRILGDEAAIAFLLNTWDVMQVWDDLVDMDNQVDPEYADKTMEWVTIGIHYDPFFNQFKGHLLPIMLMVMTSWRAANKFESAGEHLQKAYVLRAMFYALITEVARCIGLNADEAAVEVWSLYGEKLEDYIKEVENA